MGYQESKTVISALSSWKFRGCESQYVVHQKFTPGKHSEKKTEKNRKIFRETAVKGVVNTLNGALFFYDDRVHI